MSETATPPLVFRGLLPPIQPPPEPDEDRSPDSAAAVYRDVAAVLRAHLDGDAVPQDALDRLDALGAGAETHAEYPGNGADTHADPGDTPAVEPDSLLDIALQLAAAGLPVFPCTAQKRPAISKANGGNGFLDATTDPAAVRALFAKAPHAALVGVPTGEASGIDVLDIDPRHDGHLWEADHAAELPDTRIHQTLNGGRHYAFRHAPGVRNSAGTTRNSGIAPGVDVRGDGGYACWPPSPGYAVINDTDIADWPDWLLKLVLARNAQDEVRVAPRPNREHEPPEITHARIGRYVEAVLANVSRAPEGSKHPTLRNAALTIGGVLHHTDWTEAQAVDQLLAALPATVKDWNNARATALWGVQQGQRRPFDLEDRPEYRARRQAHGSDSRSAGSAGGAIDQGAAEPAPAQNSDVPLSAAESAQPGGADCDDDPAAHDQQPDDDAAKAAGANGPEPDHQPGGTDGQDQTELFGPLTVAEFIATTLAPTLARLPEVEFDLIAKTKAKELGLDDVRILSRAVARARKAAEAEAKAKAAEEKTRKKQAEIETKAREKAEAKAAAKADQQKQRRQGTSEYQHALAAIEAAEPENAVKVLIEALLRSEDPA